MLPRRLGGWRWRMLVVVVMMMVMEVSRTGAQKVETDGLEKDKYNLKTPDMRGDDAHHRGKKDDSKTPLKYMVTEEVYFDISLGSDNNDDSDKPDTERIVIACFGEITPITCLNFVALAKGHRKGRELLTYKGTPVHRIVRDFVVQMGDVTGKKGKSGKSIYGTTFQDENFELSHRGPGWVSMANYGRDTNGSQFFIMLQPARWLDGKHVVFGKVIKGMKLVRKLGELETTVTGRPKPSVKIQDCGPVGIPTKYELSESDVLSSDDIVK